MVEFLPNSFTSDCAKVLTISALQKPEIIFAVSAILSPLPICSSSPLRKIGVPPRWVTAVSEAKRVLVEDLVM
jgi:hypothetical protein